MNPPDPPIPEILDKGSLRGILFLLFFACLIAAKCAISEALRQNYGFDVNTALFIWLPSLVIGGAVCLLYITGPGSTFHPYWRSPNFLVPAALIWLTAAFSVVRNLPSLLVPASLAILAAAIAFVLGHFLRSIPVKFLAAFWLLGAVAILALPPTPSFTLFAILLVFCGAVPSAVGYYRIPHPSRESPAKKA